MRKLIHKHCLGPTATLLIQSKGVEWYGGIATMIGVCGLAVLKVLGAYYKSKSFKMESLTNTTLTLIT